MNIMAIMGGFGPRSLGVISNMAMCPDVGPPRLFRYFPTVAVKNMVSVWDRKQNILHITQPLYDSLDDLEKQIVLTSEESTLYIDDRGRLVLPRR